MGRLSRPLNRDAVKAADDEFYANHPELVKNGKRIPLLAMDPRQNEWRELYKKHGGKEEDDTKKAPPKKPVDLVQSCSSATAPTELDDCKKIKDYAQEGDIVLRGQRGDQESEFIAKISRCDFSHAGIVARNDKGELVVVDAYPGRDSGAVAAHSVDDFFCGHNATQGLVARPKDCTKAKQAAQWAMEQTKDPDYKFDLFDPWNKDPKQLYCADFVYQSYQNAGLDLVPDKMDFLSPANKSNTFSQVRTLKPEARLLPDSKLEKELLEKVKGSSEYITPCQVANNPNNDAVVKFNAAKLSSSSSKKSGKKLRA